MTTDDKRTDTYTNVVTSYLLPAPHLTKVLSAPTSVVQPTVTSGQLTPVDNDIRVVQGYGPSTGLDVATIADSSLLLFTNNTGTVTETNTKRYTDSAQPIDLNLAQYGTSEIVLNTSQAASYNSNVSGGAAGLLDGSITVSNGNGGKKTTLLNMTTIGATQADLDSMLNAADHALAKLTGAAAVVGGLQSRLESQTSFTAALSDALTSGVGSLVDADMNIASTRLQALQTQQQLGIQSLSIANQNSTLIMKLFA